MQLTIELILYPGLF